MSEVEILQPGPELDALVAEKVMGWTRPLGGLCGEWRKVHEEEHAGDAEWENTQTGEYVTAEQAYSAWWWRKPTGMYSKAVPAYSTSIADAWEVLPKLHRLNYVVYINPSSLGGGYVECFYPGHDAEDSFPEFFDVCGQQVPHAICLAALKAVGELK